mgnify:CR=1 FL=1
MSTGVNNAGGKAMLGTDTLTSAQLLKLATPADYSTTSSESLSDTAPMSPHSASMSPRPSREIEDPQYVGTYRIERLLGKGSYGKVRLATDVRTNKKVALKSIVKANVKKATQMARIKREVKLFNLLQHPNIVELYDVLHTDKEIILVIEYAGGGELFDYIVAHDKLKEKDARKIFRQLVSAVRYCHENFIVHRDIKPENVLLDEHHNIKLTGTSALFNRYA